MRLRRKAVFAVSVAAVMTVGGSAGAQTAMQSDSWNLSRAMITNDLNGGANPTNIPAPTTGQWSFMENPSGVLFPASNTAFTLLSAYTVGCLDPSTVPNGSFNCFQTVASPGSLPLIGVSPFAVVTFPTVLTSFQLIQGMPMLHPGPTSQAVVRWTSPQNQKVRILGRIADVDGSCGDGIQWGIQKDVSPVVGSALTPVAPYLNYTSLQSSASTFTVRNVVIQAGASIYFIVDKGAFGAGGQGTPANHLCDSTTLDVLITKLP